VQQNCHLLEAYRAVYLPSRMRVRSHRCHPPTPEQLEQIREYLSQRMGKPASPNILLHLEALAHKLRQYRIYRRGGKVNVQSIDQAELPYKIERRLRQPTDEAESYQTDFLRQYRQQFLAALDRALAQVIQTRYRKIRPEERADRYLAGLKLVYCQQMPMAAIARRFGMRAQDSVVILLKLSALRTDVRHQMLGILKQQVQELAQAFMGMSQLEALSDRIEQVLDEQLTQFMEAEDKHFRKPKAYLERSLLADRICAYLDQLEIPICLIQEEREVSEHH
ncbi:MAG: hypothetical protein VKJ24_10545, partial [Synechococcales bacterium]|nr:hypothetical protein [Synechococcales bacterium]